PEPGTGRGEAPEPGGAAREAGPERAGARFRRPPTWKRALAWLADAVPLVALGVVLGSLLFADAPPPDQGILGLLDFVAREGAIVVPLAAFLTLAALVYFTLGHALMGATVGKALLGLRLVGPDGERPTLARSVGRSAAALLSLALFGLGSLLALFTRSGRALHDYVAGTWVVERP
ncbi:MAG TPA: RDD family protein, partial [Anaeromyxobacteraceae bacterium]|nr:RDD family protein [Anaeromyxobacteraceae bacterium]